MRFVQPPHAPAPPPEPQHTVAKVPRRLIRQQRMAPFVLRLPDQSRQIARSIEDRIHPQRIRRARHHARHHRAREVDGPVRRHEPLDETRLLPPPFVGKPIAKPAHRSIAPLTTLATCRALRASSRGSLSAPRPLTAMLTRTSRAPPEPCATTCPLVVGTNISGPRSPTM